MIAEQDVVIGLGEGVQLEARLAASPGARGGVVVCHPHPLYGGDMDNPVVIRAVEVCAELGLATLRFNFRGVGRSSGSHDGGAGECRDIEAVLDDLGGRLGEGAAIALAGYSFGAAMAARVATGGRRLAGLCLIAPPLASRPLPDGLAKFPRPLLVVAGTRDEHAPADALEGLRATLPRAQVTIIDGANHFFFGKLFPLGEAVTGWARETFG